MSNSDYNLIYYEPQNDGLCRKHSLNAYFGHAKISTSEFNKYQQTYDQEYKTKFNFESSCTSFDIVASDQKNIVSFILKSHGVYTRYYAINQIFQKNINEHVIQILDGEFFFIYSESHIYGARRQNNQWYTVDSIGGISPININVILGQKNLGFIVPVNIKTEFYTNIMLIKSIIGPVQELQNIKDFLIKTHNDKLILGHLEIPLGVCMDILEVHHKIRQSKSPGVFDSIYNEVLEYNDFLSKFTKGRYNDIDLILRYLPSIILKLVLLNIKKT